jgi:VIT1/CCC1 family predicted Fe2+/Mn2+ transporter
MLSRDLDKAKEAFKNRNAEASRKAHDGRAEAEEEHTQEQGKYVKSIVYGGLDGIITTFAVVAGVAGATLSAGVVLILGFANLIADGLSMAIGDFLSTRAENEYNQAERQREEWEVDNYPEGEKRELVEIYTEKGLPEADATDVVEILSGHRDAWVDIMMVEELGIVEETESPWRNAVATFFSFGIFGFVPLLAYVIGRTVPAFEAAMFPAAIVLTGITLFALGALKVKFTERNWFWSGLEMLLVGGVAALAAYGIGALLSGLA